VSRKLEARARRDAAAERRLVRQFAVFMRRKLRENRFKGGWREETGEFLMEKFHEEVGELVEAIEADNLSQFDLRDVQEEAADVANMAMILADWFARRVASRPESA
jgi:NTP pyrophosphatase (non-canonical NTP hydrolase)